MNGIFERIMSRQPGDNDEREFEIGQREIPSALAQLLGGDEP